MLYKKNHPLEVVFCYHDTQPKVDKKYNHFCSICAQIFAKLDGTSYLFFIPNSSDLIA